MIIKKGIYLALLCMCIYNIAQAQYYYQDIINTENMTKEHRQYRENKISHIRIKSYDDNNEINTNFHCVKEFSDDFKRVITRTGSFETGNSVVYSDFDDQGRITRSTDSTANSVNDTRYYYDKMRPEQIDSLRFISYSIQNADTFRYNESHIYEYDSTGKPLKMIRLKNDSPFSVVTFTTNSEGSVIKESEKGRYDTVPAAYYKYNASGQPTDIFHFNADKQRMVPDFLFDYDPQNRLTEKTTVTMNRNSYLVWKFFYGDKGLVDKEACYGPKDALLGTMKFEYTSR